MNKQLHICHYNETFNKSEKLESTLLFVSATFQRKRLSNVCDAKLLRNFCNFILVTAAMRCLSSEGILKIGTLNSKTILRRTQISYLT